MKALHERIAKRRSITKSELDNEEAERDDDGKLVPLTNRDLTLILRTDHANVCRGLAVCRARGLVKPGFPFSLEPKPSVVPQDESGVSTDTDLDRPILVATVFGLQFVSVLTPRRRSYGASGRSAPTHSRNCPRYGGGIVLSSGSSVPRRASLLDL